MAATDNKPRASRPRDAASLVIHRKRGGHHEVLMGRRGKAARFKPGIYVFPGGGLERADYRARPLRPLPEEVAPQLAVASNPKRANALAMAAVREAYEEAGLIYGDHGDVGRVNHPTWRSFAEQGLAPDLSALDYLGRAVTPSYRQLRYHARFFAIPYERVSGRLGGDGELEDLKWVRLERYEGVEMMEVQEMMLETLGRRLRGHDAPAQRMIFNWGRIAKFDT